MALVIIAILIVQVWQLLQLTTYLAYVQPHMSYKEMTEIIPRCYGRMSLESCTRVMPGSIYTIPHAVTVFETDIADLSVFCPQVITFYFDRCTNMVAYDYMSSGGAWTPEWVVTNYETASGWHPNSIRGARMISYCDGALEMLNLNPVVFRYLALFLGLIMLHTIVPAVLTFGICVMYRQQKAYGIFFLSIAMLTLAYAISWYTLADIGLQAALYIILCCLTTYLVGDLAFKTTKAAQSRVMH